MTLANNAAEILDEEERRAAARELRRILRYQKGCTYDDRFVAHGLTVKGMQGESSIPAEQPCGWFRKNTFVCPNCGRRVCFCMGHGDCDLCDECCAKTTCGGDDSRGP